MRVVAGEAKGRRLQVPPGLVTRPTSDRVREAVFSSLESLDAVKEARVVDVFSGTGALGIEALSRGAASATFVDHSPAAIGSIKANLAATGLSSRAQVVRADVEAWLADASGFDLAFVDPPYRFQRWPQLLGLLTAAVAVLESDRELVVDYRWDVLKRKRYGTTVVTIVRIAYS